MPRAVVLIGVFFLCVGFILADEDLTKDTLPIDIATSDYYELEAWCERLGLDAGGTRKNLEDRLRTHYGLESLPQPRDTGKEGGISIESAYNLEYFTLEVMEERYIRLSGGVVLTMEDTESAATHEIRAERIVFNQDTGSMTASGNIEYVLTREGNSEVFRGDSLTFDTDSWEGVFFQGISERERDTEDGSITFYYSGESIYRSEDNIVTMDNGVITSSERLPPNYSIRASRLWVLAPGEWAILNAVLYIGRVPVFYIPAFFKPGDPLFFHPSLGYMQREGYYVQTTTYLVGKQQKDTDDTTLSFLQTVGTEDLDRSVHGLFLRDKGTVPPFRKGLMDYSEKNDSYLKIMMDVYSRFGYFAGLEGDLKNLGIIKNFTLSAALGRSREIFETASGYTPLYENEEGEFISDWDSSFFFNRELPFRYGIDLNFSIKAKEFSISGKIPAYSDPYFEQDFFERAEKTDWSKMLGLETGEPTSDVSTAQQSTVWNLKASYNPAATILKPYIQSLGITSLESSMYWRSREFLDSGGNYFFYPDNLVLPDITGNIRGSLFSASYPKVAGSIDSPIAEEDSQTGGEEVRSPWENPGDRSEQEDPSSTMKEPPVRGDIPIQSSAEATPFSHSLAYVITPDFSYDTKLDSDDWEAPTDIDYAPLYSMFFGQGTLSATYNAAVYKDLLTLKAIQSLTAQKKTHLPGEGLTEEEILSYQQQDNTSTYLRLNESLLLSSHPFSGIDALKTSLVSYSLKFLAYRNEYDQDISQFTESFIDWSDEYIQEHQVQMNVTHALGDSQNTLGMVLQLPPLDNELTLTSSLKTGPLTTTLQWSAAEQDDTLVPNPFVIREKLVFLQNSFFEQELQYDYEKPGFSQSVSKMTVSFFDGNLTLLQIMSYDFLSNGFTRASTSLKLWPLSLSFSMLDTYGYTFNTEDGWSRGTETDFLLHQAGFSFSWDWESKPLWKNRVFLETALSSSWQMNLQQFTDNIFTFNMDLSCIVTEFLDITLKTRSENTATHLYIPAFMRNIGREPVPIVTDLVDSFNFFNRGSRISSHFNLKSISLEAVHKLEDWDLELSFSGKPELNNETNEYEWMPEFTVMIQWNPIPEIEKEIAIDDGIISF